ncbi:hypothetical protein BFP70_09550 [Thioclava sp. SK-1]|uniref:hypothetical protein n=1 Tax=Thioclava sp. SK-1 TaxID=1889770 RepID=UPI000825A0E2|nr:hypothetical protein [Thioclava sp. SK-1]OCX65304.1 hypothetical protein BFP70_09550 [Thioclava sp. SK-1]
MTGLGRIGAIWLGVMVYVLCGRVATAQDPFDISDICSRAAEAAARESGVPVAALTHLATVQTGQGGDLPWPWTVTIADRTQAFATREDAQLYVNQAHQAGADRFETGCFQMSYPWDAANPALLDEMFTPLPNALYAADFLTQLYLKTGDWKAATEQYLGAATPMSQRFDDRFSRLRARYAHLPMAQAGEGEIPVIPEIRVTEDGRIARADAPPAVPLIAKAGAARASLFAVAPNQAPAPAAIMAPAE